VATRVGAGFSQLGNPLEAGRQAAEQAMKPLDGKKPDLVVLFSTTGLEPGQVLTGVRAMTGEAPLVGGCSTGVITSQGAFNSGVAVLALSSDEMQVLTDIVQDVAQDPARAGRALVRQLRARKGGAYQLANELLLALVAFQPGEVMVRVVLSAGDIGGPLCRLVGGAARDPSGQIERPVFLNGEAYQNAVGAALLLTPRPVGVGVRHGYRPISRPLVVTRSEESVIYELDGAPAFQAYVEQFPDRPELALESFGQFAMDYPVGLSQIGREYIIRDPFAARSDGALECGGPIPAHAVVQIMSGDQETMLQAAREAAAEAMQPLGGRRPLLAFVFSCVSRLEYLGPAAQEEVAVIREVVGSKTPLVGLFSFGEIAAQLNSPPNLHNKTVVVGVI
jgi:hypothetical protein